LNIVADVYLPSPPPLPPPPPPIDRRLSYDAAVDAIELQSASNGLSTTYVLPPDLLLRSARVGLHLTGVADSDSTFRITGIFTNKTGIEWTGWEIIAGLQAIPVVGDPPPSNLKWLAFVSSSKFATATPSPFEHVLAITLSGPPIVLPEEVFTVNMDLTVREGSFADPIAMYPVPEPVTAVLFAIGGVGLFQVRRRKRENRQVVQSDHS